MAETAASGEVGTARLIPEPAPASAAVQPAARAERAASVGSARAAGYTSAAAM